MLPLNVFQGDRYLQRDERLSDDEFEEREEINTTCYNCFRVSSKHIILECGHSICKICLQIKPFPFSCCTTCWAFSQLRIKQAAIVMYPEGEGTCEIHREDLKFFCDNNKTLLCVTCSKSEDHEAHIHWPIEVAALLCRKYILKYWKLLDECLQDTEELIMEEKETTNAWAVMNTGHKVTYWSMSEKESAAIQEDLLEMKGKNEIAHEELIVEQRDDTFRELYQTLKQLEASLECEIREEKKNWEAMMTRQSRLLEDIITKWEDKLQKPNMELLQDFARGIFHREYERIYDQVIEEPFELSFDFFYCTVATQFLQYFQKLKSAESYHVYTLSEDKKRFIMVPAGSSGQKYPTYITGCDELVAMVESWKRNDIVGKN